MPNHSEGNGRTGRSVALPDENRPSWRPQDENATRRSRWPMSEEDDRYDDDRFMRGHWAERDRRGWDRDAGYQPRNQGYPGSVDRAPRDPSLSWRGGADRYGGMPRGYNYNDGDRPNLGTGGGLYREPWHEGAYASGGHRGKGPASYHRSDERIRELVCEALTEDDRVDATHIEVAVKAGEVTLTGTVDERPMKRFAEDCVEAISGVRDVQNQIRVADEKRPRTS